MNGPSVSAGENGDILHQQTVMLSEIDEKTRDRLVGLARARLAGDESVHQQLSIFFRQRHLPYPDEAGLKHIVDSNDMAVEIPEEADEIAEAFIDKKEQYSHHRYRVAMRPIFTRATYEATGKLLVRIRENDNALFEALEKADEGSIKDIIRKIYAIWMYSDNEGLERDPKVVAKVLYNMAYGISLMKQDDDADFIEEAHAKVVELDPELKGEKEKLEHSMRIFDELGPMFGSSKGVSVLMEDEGEAKRFARLMTEFIQSVMEHKVQIIGLESGVYGLAYEAQRLKNQLEGKAVLPRQKVSSCGSVEDICVAMILAEYGGDEYRDIFSRAVESAGGKMIGIRNELLESYFAKGGDLSRRLVCKYITKETKLEDHKIRLEKIADVLHTANQITAEGVRRRIASKSPMRPGEKEEMSRKARRFAITVIARMISEDVIKAKIINGGTTKRDFEYVIDKVVFLIRVSLITGEEGGVLLEEIGKDIGGEHVPGGLELSEERVRNYYDPDQLGEAFYAEAAQIFAYKLNNYNAQVDVDLFKDHHILSREFLRYLLEIGMEDGAEAAMAFFKKNREKYEVIMKNMSASEFLDLQGFKLEIITPAVRDELYKIFFSNLKDAKEFIKTLAVAWMGKGGRENSDQGLQAHSVNTDIITANLLSEKMVRKDPSVLDYLIEMFGHNNQEYFYGPGRLLAEAISGLSERKPKYKKILEGLILSEEDLKNVVKCLKINRCLLARMKPRDRREFMEEFCALPIFWADGGARTSALQLAGRFFEEEADAK
ncbi:MAG: hypothetical protein WCT36_05515, partial [Candidatus Gracilibacteria bacterium]